MVFNKKGQKGFFFSERQETKDLLNSLRMSVGVPGRYGCRERHVHYKSRDTGFLWNVSGLILKESFFFFARSVLLILQKRYCCRHTPTETDIQTEKFRACFSFVCLRFCLGVIKQTSDINSSEGSVGSEGRRSVQELKPLECLVVGSWGH